MTNKLNEKRYGSSSLPIPMRLSQSGTKFKMLAVLGVLLMGSTIMAPAASVTFRVNMEGYIAQGKFNPGNGDTVVVSGNWNNWSTTVSPLTVSSYNSNIYVGTFTISDWTWANYSYVIDPSGGGNLWESTSTWLYVTNGTQIAPISFINNYLGYIVGADMSMVNYETNWYTYKENGVAKDPFLVINDKGFNAVRLRLLTSSSAHAQADPGDSINNLTYTLPLAQRVKSNGLKLLLDFCYDDAWGSGPMPSAWTNLNFTQLVAQMRSYNSNSIAALKAAGAMPDFVQIGNELWGHFLDPYGETGGNYDTPAQWSQLGQLMKAAIQGIADAAGPNNMPAIVIHCAHPDSWFIGNLIAQGVPFDIIAESAYENQRNESVTNTDYNSFSGTLTNIQALYNKPQLLAETSFPASTNGWTTGPTDWFGIQASLAGQVQYVVALSNAVRRVSGGQVPGVFWWGTEYVSYSYFPETWGGMFDWSTGILPVADAYGLLSSVLITDGNYKLTAWSGYVLDDTAWGQDGTGLDQWTYNGQANQQWQITRVHGNQYKIASVTWTNLVVDAVGGGQLILHPYTGVSSQLWTFKAAGSYYNLVNVGTGKAMDDWGGGLGTSVAQYGQYANANNQKWNLSAP